MRSLAFLIVFATPAFAHRLTAEARAAADTLTVVVGYEDETPAEGAKVRVFAGTEEVGSGTTDETGTVKFPRPPAGRVRVVADDGTGHRCETEFDVPATESAAQPADRPARWPRVLGGLLLIAGGTAVWKRRRQLNSTM